MKALIISDIHSNVYALEAIRKAEPDYDFIYCAGDLVDYGPLPREAIEWVRKHEAICVRGNHDDIIIDLYRNGNGGRNVAEDELKWAHCNARLLGEAEISFLERMPVCRAFEMDGRSYIMQHLYDDYLTIDSLPKYDAFWAERSGGASGTAGERRIIFGHTHRRCAHYLSDAALWLNPGSVSYRRRDDPSKEAHYITITDGAISMKSLAYDRAPLLEAARALRLKEADLKTAHFFFG
ncbi:metallophosphoesterase family protein [Paenibacillus methanolicus]|uniref:Putative phosphodiesterase n=1 Tax=Paenibacillus methanolicus TaxID=582686 RepID=A0A5S5BRN8_9BACL|nr:metallophosphoesterase family protein [Paenibacillus methanolicus]TYP69865.1 putative phosphodiesterase [Paenibacillus methanolicus]